MGQFAGMSLGRDSLTGKQRRVFFVVEVRRVGVQTSARAFSIAAALLTGAVAALYWHLITAQGNQDERRPHLWLRPRCWRRQVSSLRRP